MSCTFSVSVCSLSYPASNARAPQYTAICGLSVSVIFYPHYLINGAIFGERDLLNVKCVFHFLYNFCLSYLGVVYSLYSCKCCILSCLVCIVVSCLVSTDVVALCVLLLVVLCVLLLVAL